MAYPVTHRGKRAKPVCCHQFVDAANICLDCEEFIPSHSEAGELCIYCCTDPVSDEHYPYCSNLCAIVARVA